ncbi:cytidylyltransferase domain-containing protein [Colwellia echini]|uniref:Polysaccharide biosynthesis protein n=1 Tax=Colwellia echini TaxID=1982103 RepID=A0ABY3MWJ4_9GAMM|nr:glycosyltransferase family protein [Colwellia echini]TYK65596.1 polysaccharide biosynthesis protein [Colwellia echini]
MSKLFIIIQARMTSTRLPNKVLLPIGEKPALQIMIERLQGWRENIIIATTNDGSEDPIVALCETLNIRYFKGSTDNVLERYYLTAKKFGATYGDAIMRLTSDNPLIDYDLTSKVIKIYQENTYNMVSLGPHSGFPRGLDCCIFDFDCLEKTHLGAITDADKEHVTMGMTKFSDIACYNLSSGEDLSHYRLTLDEEDDYKMIQTVYALFNNQTSFNYLELLAALKDNPEVIKINQHIEQKKY